MDKRMKYSEYGGFLFTVAAGTLFHFLYEWSGQNPVTALFTPVNESTFEHLKLLFFPMFFYSILQYFFCGRAYDNFVTAKITGSISGMLAIVTLFYTYTGIIGRNFLVMDILTFILGTAFAYLLSAYLICRQPDFYFPATVNILIILFMLLVFFFCTFYPPEIPLFISPV